MLFLIAKQLWHTYEFRLLPFAVILIIVAHILNYRLSKRHRHNPTETPSQTPPGSAAVGPMTHYH
jgi:hypothetical protein